MRINLPGYGNHLRLSKGGGVYQFRSKAWVWRWRKGGRRNRVTVFQEGDTVRLKTE